MSKARPSNDFQVRIRNLSRSFQEGDRRHSVLHELSVDFMRGESVALRGRSGSGKSTLLNLISGIDAPDAGEVEVAGLNITMMSERDRFSAHEIDTEIVQNGMFPLTFLKVARELAYAYLEVIAGGRLAHPASL
jgi:ABC-type lipoprotein export system ATPase subunit